MRVDIKNKKTYSGPGVYVGRPSALSNPFKIGRDGTRDEVIAKYAVWLDERLREDCAAKTAFNDLLETLRLFEEVTLICWCAPKRCHAEVIRDKLFEVLND